MKATTTITLNSCTLSTSGRASGVGAGEGAEDWGLLEGAGIEGDWVGPDSVGDVVGMEVGRGDGDKVVGDFEGLIVGCEDGDQVVGLAVESFGETVGRLVVGTRLGDRVGMEEVGERDGWGVGWT